MKLIAIDMDGTLAGEQKIRQEQLETLQNAVGDRFLVTMVTKRTAAEIKNDLQRAISFPIIASNGATIYAPDGHLLSGTPIDRDRAEEIIDYALAHRHFVEVMTRKGAVSPENSEEIFKRELTDKKRANPALDTTQFWQRAAERIAHVHLVPIKHIKQLIKTTSIFRILVVSCFPEVLDRFRERFAAYNPVSSLISVESASIAFISNRIDKGAAVRILAKKYRIQPEDVFAIGASNYEWSDFRRAGVKTAADAPSLIKDLHWLIEKAGTSSEPIVLQNQV
ncbi:HAD family phosphatase [Sporolactobacillus sp. THM7-7]|nr:HAD family phosphatase [Sporolactobacillus sp. THM7-7]